MKKALARLVVLAAVLNAAPAFGQTTGWLDVNLGAAVPAEGTRKTTYNWTEYGWGGEQATLAVDYKQLTGANIDVGGGVMITPVFGLGIVRSGTGHIADAPVRLTLPHPRYYSSFGTGTSDAKGLEYAEGAWHIQAVVNVPIRNTRWRARIYGGPSYFTATGQGVTYVNWLQSWLGSANYVEVTGTDLKDVSFNAWGFHAGGDVAYFFHRVVGLGTVVRYSYASSTVTDDEVMANEPLDVKLGGMQVAAGLRLRFGHK